ncbi:MAG: DNA packaging protein [Ketobacter sp.]|nr:DNA packaging protein [Ketobacter sp.]
MNRDRIRALLLEKRRRELEDSLSFYEPYAKQLEFHDLGRTKTQRCLGAGNQLGKTLCAGMEVAYHLTGLYPLWWTGKRFNRRTIWWVGGVTGETIRDTCQRILVGRVELDEVGTGTIPLDRLAGTQRAMGVPNLLDNVRVRHEDGDESILFFKSYEKGRKKWQGETIDGVWFDEEPPLDVYTEGLTRTNANGQFTMLTYTPLLGMTELTMKFYEETSEAQGFVQMTIDDVGHYSEEEKRTIIASYPDHERDARIRGIPILGEGRIFQVVESAITEDRIDVIPEHWFIINGIDFGIDHPMGLVQLLWDKDSDIIHVHRAVKESGLIPATARALVSNWDSSSSSVPWAWPHDGLQHDKGSGLQLRAQYLASGFNMCFDMATHADGGNGVEAGLFEMLERMKTGRFKVARHLSKWFEEFRLYHRKGGKVVKMHDDLLCATRYALMMKRFAVQPSALGCESMTQFASRW